MTNGLLGPGTKDDSRGPGPEGATKENAMSQLTSRLQCLDDLLKCGARILFFVNRGDDRPIPEGTIVVSWPQSDDAAEQDHSGRSAQNGPKGSDST